MNAFENFLVRYGLHNFVTSAMEGGQTVFTIRRAAGRKMVGHARDLIADAFGQTAAIRLA